MTGIPIDAPMPTDVPVVDPEAVGTDEKIAELELGRVALEDKKSPEGPEHRGSKKGIITVGDTRLREAVEAGRAREASGYYDQDVDEF